MGRKFRLGTHRKNEERKKLAAKRNQPLIVSVPVQHFMTARVPFLNVLRKRIQELHILPQGSVVLFSR